MKDLTATWLRVDRLTFMDSIKILTFTAIQLHLNRLKIAWLNDVFYLMLAAMEFKDVGGWRCIPSYANQTLRRVLELVRVHDQNLR